MVEELTPEIIQQLQDEMSEIRKDHNKTLRSMRVPSLEEQVYQLQSEVNAQKNKIKALEDQIAAIITVVKLHF